MSLTIETDRIEQFGSELSENLKEDVEPGISTSSLVIDASIGLRA